MGIKIVHHNTNGRITQRELHLERLKVNRIHFIPTAPQNKAWIRILKARGKEQSQRTNGVDNYRQTLKERISHGINGLREPRTKIPGSWACARRWIISVSVSIVRWTRLNDKSLYPRNSISKLLESENILNIKL